MNAHTQTADRAAAVAQAMARYRERCPASERQFNAATEVLPGGNTRSVLFHEPFPLTMVRGEGCWLWDADGHRYLDALGEFTAGLYGHSNAAIREAIHAALAQGLSLSSHTAREAALALEIRARFPSMELLRFTNSGTEANLLALAAAIAHTGRRKVLVFDGAYHGGVLSFGGGASPVNVPHDFVIAPYNDLDAVRAIVRSRWRRRWRRSWSSPCSARAAASPAKPPFLAGLRELADACGAMLIFDEVMTSRLSIGGRQAQLGIRPDLTTLGKYFGGGLSFGAFGGRADLMARFDPRRADALGHAGTFNNNVLTMAAGLAGLQQVLTPAALAGAEPARRVAARARECLVRAPRRGSAVQRPGFADDAARHRAAVARAGRCCRHRPARQGAAVLRAARARRVHGAARFRRAVAAVR